ITGDIDNDGDLEVFGGCHGYGILERHHTGDTVTGWPVDIYNLECSPIIFDLDNDGEREIVFGDNSSSFYAYNGDGSIVENWPIPSGGGAMVNSAAVGDVDGDGDIEIALVVNNGTVNLWTIKDMPYHSYLTDWGTFYHDIWNTGWMHPVPPKNLNVFYTSYNCNYLTWNKNTEPDIAGYNIYKSNISGGPYTKINSELVEDTTYIDVSGTANDFYCVTAEIQACTESRLSDEAYFTTGTNNYGYQKLFSIFAYPNPFKQSTIISFTLPDETENAQILIFNIKGQKIKTFSVILSGVEGQYSIVWDGKDNSGNTVEKGVYFCRLRLNDSFSQIKKIIFL
ncbi:MAG: VCBS repeat-containing protein, partial [Bacteroidales bacterium]|nr:VCBS repeat-containing protein [Bacteroidales bacterium]